MFAFLQWNLPASQQTFQADYSLPMSVHLKFFLIDYVPLPEQLHALIAD